MARSTAPIILTTFGTDGAATAAVVLLLHPEAEILRTSSTRVGMSLQEIADRHPTRVHVCGVGPNDTRERILSGLQTLAEKGFSLVWYCGRGYMDQWRELIAPHCEPAFYDCVSNAGAAARHLRLHGRRRRGVDPERVRLLVALGEEYADSTRTRPGKHHFWHDLVQQAATRYFRYEDGDAFVQAVRKLAGLVPVTTGDEDDVKDYRRRQDSKIPLGSSKAMRALRRLVRRIAPLEEPVLILGQSGTGKELVARMLHDGSRRKHAAFVPVNCALLSTSQDLAHDRLFGHVAGAYTGAAGNQPGAFESAHGGTLFLDEVAELPPGVQTQLLRVLEEKRVTPLGTTASLHVDVRVLAATNQDLAGMMRRGSFRLDLYHRLGVLRLRVPALRERKEDMRAIADAVIYELGRRGVKLRISAADWQALRDYSWPGNVRQFINLLKRAALMGSPVRRILAEEREEFSATMPAAPRATTGGDLPGGLPLPETLGQVAPLAVMQRAYMRRALNICGGNYTRASKLLGVAVNTLRKHVPPGEA